MSDQSPLTSLNSYQEAMRLSVSMDLRIAIQSAHLTILKDPGLPNPTLALEAKSAYCSAVAALIRTKIPLSDEMVHSDLEHLRGLALQIEADTDQAAYLVSGSPEICGC
jgi:hypothetical protein